MVQLERKMKTVYKAFGLTLTGDFHFPQLPDVQTNVPLSDVFIIQADLRSLWKEWAKPNDIFVYHEDFVMFRAPGVAIYLIKNGTEIFVSPMDGTDEDKVRFFILGTCMGVILLQRKVLPLHGSAVVIDSKAYAIVGDSGAGKSTLAAAFMEKGHPLLSDDVIPVTFSEEHVPIVHPAYPQQKMWLNSMEAFGMEKEDCLPIFNRQDKYTVRVEDNFAEIAVPLAGVFELTKIDNNAIEMSPVHSSLNALHLLFRHTYRSFLVNRLNLSAWHFQYTTKLASQVNVYQLHRPTARFTAYELADCILEEVSE
ncbi:aldolase [Virgibacillus sp. W0181]|uniref:aldolase n=1 Tax=Virgibacillus sp. W0181 TaxID=3391581 RepID=UPI003F47A491